MATKTVLTLHGMEALQAALVRAPALVKDRTAEAVQQTTFAIAQRMRTLAPRGETGTLARSIEPRARGNSGGVWIGLDAWYWYFLEYGTRHIAARPFARAAAEAESPTFEHRIRQIGQALEQDFSKGGGTL
jgi:HK97 gp10 family phage protein